MRARGVANQTCGGTHDVTPNQHVFAKHCRQAARWKDTHWQRHADGVAIGPCVPFSKSIIPRRWAADKSVVVDVLGRYYSDLTARATFASVACTASSEQMEICVGARTRAVVVLFSVTFSFITAEEAALELRHTVVCEIDRQQLGRPASPNNL